MKTAPVLLLVFLAFVCLSHCKDLKVGTRFVGTLRYEKAQYKAIPLMKRVKEVYISDPGHQPIKGIIAFDMDHSAAEATITAGGVGFSYANIRLKSERGLPLNYLIEIWT